MLRLLTFLSTHRNTILFLFLEGVALYLIVRTNDSQRHQVGDTLLEVSGATQDVRRDVVKYFEYGRVNDSLNRINSQKDLEMMRLRQEIERLRSEMERDSMVGAWVDSSYATQDSFGFIPARVLRNSTHKAYNYLTLDKGADSGLESGMGVASPQGLVGKVIKVSQGYALVQSAINLDFSVPLRVHTRKTQGVTSFLGFYRWKIGDISQAEVSNMPETAGSRLSLGDEVVTAGTSTVFPAGIKVGTLTSDQSESIQGVYTCTMELAVDFSTLRHVYAIKSFKQPALDSLEMGLP